MELADRSLWDRFAEARRRGLAGIPMGELLGILGEVRRVIDFLNEPRHELEERSGVAIHHRDIKPQNIMLIGQGVKVADFGLSCLGDPGGSAKSQCGLTFAYAAPETFRRRVFATSDQYSLAVTYCQLRGGRLPFVGPPASVMMGHLFGDPDLSMLPESERPVVARALAKQPGERWPDCRSFIEVLAGCAGPVRPTFCAVRAVLRRAAPMSRLRIEIPPLSESWDGPNSVSSDGPGKPVTTTASAPIARLATPEALDAGLHGESSSRPRSWWPRARRPSAPPGALDTWWPRPRSWSPGWSHGRPRRGPTAGRGCLRRRAGSRPLR